MLVWFSREVDLYAVLDEWRAARRNYRPGESVDDSWYADRYEVLLGKAVEHGLFDMAARRLFRYAFYPESFVSVAADFIREDRAPEVEERIVQRVRVIPGVVDAVTMNIVESVWQEPDRRGFTLVTSERQYERGEWTASIARDTGGNVLLQVCVVSRPSQRLPLPARIFARALQKHAHNLGLKRFAAAVRSTNPHKQGLAPY